MSTKRLRLFSCAFCFQIGNGLTTGKTSACWQCEEGAYHCVGYPKKVVGLCLHWLEELRVIVMYLIHGSNFTPYTVWSETQSHHIFHFGDLPKVVEKPGKWKSQCLFSVLYLHFDMISTKRIALDDIPGHSKLQRKNAKNIQLWRPVPHEGYCHKFVSKYILYAEVEMIQRGRKENKNIPLRAAAIRNCHILGKYRIETKHNVLNRRFLH